VTQPLVLEFARTIRLDSDELATDAGFSAWVRSHTEGYEGVEHARHEAIALRRAIRSLLARAVQPDPPGEPNDRQLNPEIALAQLNSAAAAVLRAPQLDWTDVPVVRHQVTESDAATRLLAELARSAIDLLTGEDRARLKACPAPRCVRYFIQDHPRQAWCKPSCGNRARVSRYYQRHQDSSTGKDSTP
jgi:predicted RNA-binding Zn ribbon-like protein